MRDHNQSVDVPPCSCSVVIVGTLKFCYFQGRAVLMLHCVVCRLYFNNAILIEDLHQYPNFDMKNSQNIRNFECGLTCNLFILRRDYTCATCRVMNPLQVANSLLGYSACVNISAL